MPDLRDKRRLALVEHLHTENEFKALCDDMNIHVIGQTVTGKVVVGGLPADLARLRDSANVNAVEIEV